MELKNEKDDIFTILDDLIANWLCKHTYPPEFLLLPPKEYLDILAEICHYAGLISIEHPFKYHDIPIMCSVDGIIYDEKD